MLIKLAHIAHAAKNVAFNFAFRKHRNRQHSWNGPSDQMKDVWALEKNKKFKVEVYAKMLRIKLSKKSSHRFDGLVAPSESTRQKPTETQASPPSECSHWAEVKHHEEDCTTRRLSMALIIQCEKRYKVFVQ